MHNRETIQARFGERIRSLRTQSGMSQEAFADKCGLDRTYISGIERGVRNPTLAVINTLALSLGIELKTLFDWP
ncbi:helix-turn-helix domain-containing protein [Pantoea sp. B65]